MSVYEGCRHYVMQTVRGGDRMERCRLGANEKLPFACPEGCVFMEERRTSAAGWHVPSAGSETQRRDDPGPGRSR